MERISSVDAGRFISIVAIIALHTQPFRLLPPLDDDRYQLLDAAITNFARFAVPFFFVISGYFWGIKIREGKSALSFSIKKIGRIFAAFLFWCVVYLIPYGQLRFGAGFDGVIRPTLENIKSMLQLPPIVLVMGGTALHLWFMVALMSSVAISAVFVHKKMDLSLLVFSALLYIFGILAKSYKDTPIGIDIHFNTLYGPFFGTLFFASGYHLSGQNITPGWFKYGLWIFIFGAVLHAAEIFLLWRVFQTPPRHDYVFGTYFMGMGAAVMALSDRFKIGNGFTATVGKLTMGIYAVHYVFVELFLPYDQTHNSPLWEMEYVFIVLALAMVIAYLLSRIKFVRRFVMAD